MSSFTEKSQREIKRMEDVIYTLLKLAQLDAGMIQMEKAPENLSVLMQDVLERFETWTEREHKTITLSGKEDVVLSCDALWISEAIGNIVKNALEHTEKGGHIEVKWRQSPLMTQIEISDDGKGIHPEDLYNIFKRFYRSRFSSDVHGIGLGLPLNKLMFRFLITDKWGTVWQVPVDSLFLIVFLCLASAAVAIRRPIRQISRMSIVDIIKLQQ